MIHSLKHISFRFVQLMWLDSFCYFTFWGTEGVKLQNEDIEAMRYIKKTGGQRRYEVNFEIICEGLGNSANNWIGWPLSVLDNVAGNYKISGVP